MVKTTNQYHMIVVNPWLCYVQTDPSRSRKKMILKCRTWMCGWSRSTARLGAQTVTVGGLYRPKRGLVCIEIGNQKASGVQPTQKGKIHEELKQWSRAGDFYPCLSSHQGSHVSSGIPCQSPVRLPERVPEPCCLTKRPGNRCPKLCLNRAWGSCL